MEIKEERIGQLAVRKGLISSEDLSKALEIQKKTGKKLGEVLISEGFLAEEDLYKLLEEQIGQTFLRELPIPTNIESLRPVFHKVSLDYLKKNKVAPLDLSSNVLKIAISDVMNYDLLNELKFITGYRISPVFAIPSAIDKYLDVISRKLDISSMSIEVEEEEKEAPAVKFVDAMLKDAINKGASDIHLEVYEKRVILRYRIDGVLHNFPPPPKSLYPAIVSRIKIMANLDISEHRLPQDGRIEFKSAGKNIDIRVSIIPTVWGENVVLRILSKDVSLLSIDEIGLEEEEKSIVKKELEKSQGMILVTGPTGSGKTTTLYAFISYIKKFNKKILTVEDPVEYQIEEVTQVQVNPDIGLTFANVLRAFLRHDPDVILVGEIRDLETAEIAVRSALTGHLVLSTLHTNDAPSAITRLIDMGIPPYLVTSTLNMVIAQRLVRKLCNNCKKETTITKELLNSLGTQDILHPNDKIFEPVGCNKCYMGYSGRIPIFEILTIDEDLRRLVLKGSSSFELKRKAMEKGFKTLRLSALEKVKKGLTSIEEVFRVTIEE